MENLIHNLIDLVMSTGTRLIGALLTVIIGLIISKRFIKHLSKNKGFLRLEKNAQAFFLSFLSVVSKIIVFLTAAAILGIPMTNFVAVLGSCGLAIGLALQGSLSNLAGGIMLLIFKPFKNGDFIEAEGFSGSVQDITILYTHLKTADGKVVVMPNGKLSNATVVNYSSEKLRRVNTEIGISYSSDINTAKEVLLKLAEGNELILKDPAPAVNVTAYEDSSVKLRLSVWCENAEYWNVTFYINNNLKDALNEKGIEIPFPQLDVHISK